MERHPDRADSPLQRIIAEKQLAKSSILEAEQARQQGDGFLLQQRKRRVRKVVLESAGLVSPITSKTE
jgi:hypothetical protein